MSENERHLKIKCQEIENSTATNMISPLPMKKNSERRNKWKKCHYFDKGYCNYKDNCLFIHPLIASVTITKVKCVDLFTLTCQMLLWQIQMTIQMKPTILFSHYKVQFKKEVKLFKDIREFFKKNLNHMPDKT